MIDRLEWFSDEHAARITLTGNAAPDALDASCPARAGRTSCPTCRTSATSSTGRRRTGASRLPRPRVGAARLPGRRRARGARPPLGRGRSRLPARRGRPRGSLEGARWSAPATSRRADRAAVRRIRLHGPGTDVTVGLIPSSVWHAADFGTVDGIRHYPNIPSEETFTTPDPARVDGHVTATRPLEVYGAMIDGMRVEFEGGRAVKIDADEAPTRCVRLHEGRWSVAARRARARRRCGTDRSARHGVLRHAARRERRQPHRARLRLRARRHR